MKDAERKRRFDALARQYADDLFRFGVWMCGDHALANDLVQETFVRAWKALDSLKDAGAAKSWLREKLQPAARAGNIHELT